MYYITVYISNFLCESGGCGLVLARIAIRSLAWHDFGLRYRWALVSLTETTTIALEFTNAVKYIAWYIVQTTRADSTLARANHVIRRSVIRQLHQPRLNHLFHTRIKVLWLLLLLLLCICDCPCKNQPSSHKN